MMKRTHLDNQKANRAPRIQMVRTMVESLKEVGRMSDKKSPPMIVPKVSGNTLTVRV